MFRQLIVIAKRLSNPRHPAHARIRAATDLRVADVAAPSLWQSSPIGLNNPAYGLPTEHLLRQLVGEGTDRVCLRNQSPWNFTVRGGGPT
jgi:hypothetical protein